MNAREKFCTVLNSGPILAPDAMVVLCGEDAMPRLKFAVGKLHEFAHWAAHQKIEDYAPPIVLTGGLNDPPAKMGAETLAPKVLAAGVAPDRLILDTAAMNTREQAVNVVALAKEHGWRRLMLVVSPYHAPRAFLTFLKAAMEADIDKALEINVATASHVPWWKAPEGCEDTRYTLLELDVDKAEIYADHVATWEDGLAYLEYWEGREEKRGK